MYGHSDLKSRIAISEFDVECPVIGCRNKVERQRQVFKREDRFYCPDHRIYISPSTFEYETERDNLLWKNEADAALLKAIKTVKRESRITRDNSEDAVTWNVFRFLENSSQVDQFLKWITQTEQHNAELIYWSYSQNAQGAWPELNEARIEFGESLDRSSEPDLIAVTDKGLFFIEAKLNATNETMPSDHDNRKKYLTGGDEWFRQVFISDYETIAIKSKLYELLRFWLLGSWMASRTGRDFYLINVVLSEREKNIEQRFNPHIRKGINQHFKRITWEEINSFIAHYAPESNDKSAIPQYYRNKTIGYNRFGELQKAFTVQ